MASKKVILAYSGGLDTSVILKWLQEEKNLEVVTYTADMGQGDIPSDLEKRAKGFGAVKVIVDDLSEEFVSNYVFPMFRCNTLYEGEYLLGTAIARPLIAKRLVDIAASEDTNIISHGATGKGNDQIRFEMGAHALNPNIEVIAPWREWDLSSRTDLMNYCKENQIPMPASKAEEPPFSMDENLLHISYEGGVLEDLSNPPPEDMWLKVKSLDDAKADAEEIKISFKKGDPIEINDTKYSAAELLKVLNNLGCEHGIGRIDIVESRATGMKSRGCYETPGGTILLKARRAIESLCLSRDEILEKDAFMPSYAKLIYDGLWWSDKRLDLQKRIDSMSEKVCGTINLQLFKGNIITLGKESENSLYDENKASFEAQGGFSNQDMAEHIKKNILEFNK
ncbi:MAG: argininosuccinate synthase [Pseudomonadota bacterium]|nr:argininosuccinate synthase [Pseudomonadota bacterium]MEC8169168.1 argininosuccinate synthase [Pseudomonadota bacterium]|tara:strand:- start:5098 stop:6282 length:1185 start_codon:yes stop_codon:yes gene_type:complete